MQLVAHTRFLIAIALSLAAINVGAQSRVYRWVDAEGVVHFSDQRPADSDDVVAEALVVRESSGHLRIADAPAESASVLEPESAPEPQPEAAPVAAQARDCSSPSPRKQSGQDLYAFPNDRPEPLRAEEVESFETLIKGMVGRWSGTDVGFACGREASRRQASRVIASEGRAAGPAEFVLDSTISSQDSNQRELLRIELRDQRLWVNHTYASLISVSDRVLAFGYRQRTAGAIAGTGGSVMESQWRIELDGRRELKIEHVHWANGTLVETSTWEFRKPF
jgi:hypothetical protein